MAEVLGAPASPPATSSAAHVRRGGLALAVASVASNLLGYAFAVVLSRALGPGGYGALSALLALGLIGSVPAIALQLLVARETTDRPDRAADWVRTSAVLGVALMVMMWLAAPVATEFLGLSSPLPVLLLGVTLLPVTVVGALQGVLLSARRYGGLAASYLLLSGLRLAGAGTAAVLGWSVAGAIAAAAAGTAVAGLVVAGVTARDVPLLRRGPVAADAGLRLHLRLLVAAASATAAILVLANVDVVLARHYLGATESGQYAIGALFAKASFWAPHFLAVLVFPMLVTRGGRRRALLITIALTVAIGGVVVLGALLFAQLLLEPTVGPGYSHGADLAPLFAVLGVLQAVLQLLLFAGLARRTRRVEALVWSGIAVQVALIAGWFHDSPEQVLGTSIAVCAVLAALIVLDELRPGAVRPVGSRGSVGSRAGRRDDA